ncbi:MAG: Holliday junction resolvase RuvX [Hamadaea sp.]|uniref:Holliday junction resolvase RuvX n=1 Tax=Hamadaea sp. TaxID=2024425 RepID=UPI001817EB74|nr:Holliday junction resolvase RuvX [Hamadaea sp.]NUT18258.1 Holliday junction resolvase RuvX [Hamadaea sp.]
MSAPWVRGVRLGIDVGSVRVGVAKCDPDGILATPLITLARDNSIDVAALDTAAIRSATVGVPADIAEIKHLVTEHDSVEVVVGLPVNLAGMEGPAAKKVREYVRVLAEVIAPVPIVMADERMSTVTAARRLSDRGVKGKRQRAVVDQAAAVEILQHYLESRRRQG